MTQKQFDTLLMERINKMTDVLSIKAKEYAPEGTDRLHNFNIGAQISGTTRERVLHGFMLKHFISYLDILSELDAGNVHKLTEEYIDEKFGDLINYFFLQEVSIKEKIRERNNMIEMEKKDLELVREGAIV